MRVGGFPRRFAVGFFIFAIAASTIAAWYHRHLRTEREHWRSVWGEVTAISAPYRRTRTYSADYDVDGARYQTGHLAVSGVNPEIGDRIVVYYNPANPAESEFRSDSQDEAFLAAPFIWLGIGLLVWWWRRRVNRWNTGTPPGA